ncbi:MAG: SRPBCC family protein [Myxococcales bacterium]|nr:SRPBCC family protein [Myxococcales bacterium]
MPEHSATVVVNAPVHQVYALYSHFNDYPKFMTFVNEVTYLDDQHSHWVVDVVGTHSWDAVNEGWISDRQIGWRSTDGLENSGTVRFEPLAADRTAVTVTVRYRPPGGLLGNVGEVLGVGGRFQRRLQHDLDRFAEMVSHAPPGALDPTSSAYLFHPDSAVVRGSTTRAQDESMGIGPKGAGPVPGGRAESGLVTSTVSASEAEGSLGSDDALTLDPGVPPVPGTSRRGDRPAES